VALGDFFFFFLALMAAAFLAQMSGEWHSSGLVMGFKWFWSYIGDSIIAEEFPFILFSTSRKLDEDS